MIPMKHVENYNGQLLNRGPLANPGHTHLGILILEYPPPPGCVLAEFRGCSYIYTDIERVKRKGKKGQKTNQFGHVDLFLSRN